MNIQKKLINTTRFQNYLPQSMLSSAIRAGHVLSSGDNGLGHKSWATMTSLRHILMGRNGVYFLNYIDYSKNFAAVLKLLLVI